jgi:tRNA-dihydrouridine synthase B
MIGRGALKNPWIFKEALGHDVATRDFIALIHRHFDLAIAKKDPQRAFLSLKKFMGWYAAGFPYSSVFRSQIFKTRDVNELKSIALDYFGSVKMSDRHDENQPFLMGGHG